MPLRYHHGGSSFRTPAAPGKKSEASKKIGQSRRLARINTGISAARNPDFRQTARHPKAYMVTKKR